MPYLCIFDNGIPRVVARGTEAVYARLGLQKDENGMYGPPPSSDTPKQIVNVKTQNDSQNDG
jgi:hypothetical protein